MRAATTLRQDLVFQFRHGFYYAYFFVAIIYIVLLRYVPIGLRETLAVLLVFSDTSVVGFFFIAGQILLEKDQRILESLFTTPLRPQEYIVSKMVSMGVLSVVMGLLIIMLSIGLQAITVLFILGLALNASIFTLAGIIACTRTKTMNQFILTSIFYLFPFLLPLLNYFSITDILILEFFPTNPALTLIGSISGEVSGHRILLSSGILVFWLVVCSFWAFSWFNKYVILGIGTGS